MDERQDNTKLSLEEIMKEFGTEAGTPDQADLEEAKEQMPIAHEPSLEERLKALLGENDEDEDVKRFVPQTQTPDTAVDGQTIRVDTDQVREAMNAAQASGDATIRFEPVEQSLLRKSAVTLLSVLPRWGRTRIRSRRMPNPSVPLGSLNMILLWANISLRSQSFSGPGPVCMSLSAS